MTKYFEEVIDPWNSKSTFEIIGNGVCTLKSISYNLNSRLPPFQGSNTVYKLAKADTLVNIVSALLRVQYLRAENDNISPGSAICIGCHFGFFGFKSCSFGALLGLFLTERKEKILKLKFKAKSLNLKRYHLWRKWRGNMNLFTFWNRQTFFLD